MMISERLKYLLNKKEEIEEEIDNLDIKKQEKQKELNFLNSWINEFKICSNCKGKGGVHKSYAQDDVRFERCEKCNGTGLKS